MINDSSGQCTMASGTAQSSRATTIVHETGKQYMKLALLQKSAAQQISSSAHAASDECRKLGDALRQDAAVAEQCRSGMRARVLVRLMTEPRAWHRDTVGQCGSAAPTLVPCSMCEFACYHCCDHGLHAFIPDGIGLYGSLIASISLS